MTGLVGVSGVGGLSPVDLGKMLSGQIANASLSMGSYTHGVGGGSTPKDLETALQLMYLSFTAANHDPDAFELMKRRLRANLVNQGQSPGAVFGERVRLVNTVNNYMSRSMKVEDVDALDQSKMEAFYKSQVRQRRRTSRSSSSARSTWRRSNRCWRPTSARCRRRASPRPPTAPCGCSFRPTSRKRS